jgi:hypothetical protein
MSPHSSQRERRDVELPQIREHAIVVDATEREGPEIIGVTVSGEATENKGAFAGGIDDEGRVGMILPSWMRPSRIADQWRRINHAR